MIPKISRRGCLLLAPPALVSAAGFGFVWPEATRRLGRGWQWLSDQNPPVVSLYVPDSPVRGETMIGVVVRDDSNWTIVSLDLDGTPLAPIEGNHRLDTRMLPDGPHTVRIRVRDNSRQANETGAEATFTSQNNGPEIELDQRSTQVGQGKTLTIRVRTTVPAKVEGTLGTMPLAFVDDAHDHWALAGFDALDRVGTRPLKLTATDEFGNKRQLTANVTLGAVKYPNEEVWLPPDPGGGTPIDSSANAREIARLDALFAKVSQPRRWTGPFVRPVPQEASSDFATGRSYNGGPITSRHWGTDLAAPMSTPVVAPAPGTVVLVDTLVVRGNAVILDHGLGVYTGLYHLSRQDVREGEQVDAGARIGLSGATGAVTGPHLHWEMRVRGQAVDPVEWTANRFP